jgi:hypothetical protein
MNMLMSAEYEVNAEALATAIAEGKEAVDAAETTEDVEAAVVAAKEAIDAIETDEEIAVREAEEAAAELAAAKETAKAELDEYVDVAEYETNAEALATAIAEGKEAVDAAETTEDVEAAVVAAKEAIDAIETDEEIAVREAEEAAAELAAAIEAADVAISELPETVTLEDVDAVEAARTLVQEAMDLGAVEADFEFLATLEAAEDTIDALQAEAELVATAEEAVVAYEEFVVANYNDIAAAEELKVAAETAVAEVTEGEDFTARITAQEEALQEVVDAVVAAVNGATNEVNLLSALDFFNEVNADRITAYDGVLDGTQTTVEAIQLSIYTINDTAAVNAATNQVQLLAALNAGMEHGVFTDVNEDLITQYAAGGAINVAGAPNSHTTAQIQGFINTVNTNADIAEENLEAATTAVEALEVEVAGAGDVTDLTEINAEIVTVTGLVTAAGDPAGLTARMATIQTKVDTVAAVILAEADITVLANFNAAQVDVLRLEDSELKTALQARLDVFADVVAMNGAADAPAAETVLTAQNPDGFAALEDASKTIVATAVWNSGTNYTTVAAYNNAVADAITEYTTVDAVNNANTEAELLTALQTGEATLYSDEATPVFTADSVDEELSALYWAAHQGYDDFDGNPVAAAVVTDAASIQTSIIGAINTLVTTADNALTAYVAAPATIATASGTGETLQNAINALPEGALANEFNAQLLVGEAELTLLVADDTAAQTAVTALPTGDLKTALQNRLDTIGFVVDMNAATDATEAKDVLDEQLPTGYAALSDALKVKVATIVWNTGTDYTSVAGYNTAVAGAIQLHTVNNASNSTEARTALQPIAVAATASTDYLNLSATSKLEVAELFLDDDAFVALAGARTSVDADGDYTAVADVKTDLETLTGAYDDLFNVATVGINTAANITDMVTALSAIGYDAFDDLNSVDQFDVAEAFLNAFPEESDGTPIPYTNLAAVKADIDAAIAGL